jgi:hypothetical protein
MKAWKVWRYSEWDAQVVWADTREKAKARSEAYAYLGRQEWKNIKAYRAPEFDGEPRLITDKEYLASGMTGGCSRCHELILPDGEGVTFSPDGQAYCPKCSNRQNRSTGILGGLRGIVARFAGKSPANAKTG